MCYDQSCLGYLLVAVIVGFAGVIYFSLRYRKQFLENNLRLSADQVWEGVANRAVQANLKKSDLLFSINQDGSASTAVLVIKDFNDQVVGRVECPIGSREYKIWVGQDLYRINFLFTAWRSAHLNPGANESVLASYKTLSRLGKHEFNIPGYGPLISERPNLNLRGIINYRSGNIIVGTTQSISFTREIGKLVVLPSEIPLHIRIFILAL